MFTLEEITNNILVGNCLDLIKQYPDECVDCIISSPPYLAKRSYGTNYQIWDADDNCNHEWKIINKVLENKICTKCNAFYGELGQEETPERYIKHLAQIFIECKRILKPMGTMWINIADSYYSSDMGRHSYLKDKDLIGLPWLLSIELQKAGYYLRNDIIWAKTCYMPQSVMDRCTTSHEYILFFAKAHEYYFDLDPVREKAKTNKRLYVKGNKAVEYIKKDENNNNLQIIQNGKSANEPHHLGKRKNDVWMVNTVGSVPSFKELKEACGENDIHPAAYSEELMQPCVLAGCPENGVVFDPFQGSGTSAVIALKNKRKFSGTEINPNFKKIALQRIANLNLDKINGNSCLNDLIQY